MCITYFTSFVYIPGSLGNLNICNIAVPKDNFSCTFLGKKIGFLKRKICGFFCSQFQIILQNVNSTIGQSPETPAIAAKPLEASSKAASPLYIALGSMYLCMYLCMYV